MLSSVLSASFTGKRDVCRGAFFERGFRGGLPSAAFGFNVGLAFGIIVVDEDGAGLGAAILAFLGFLVERSGCGLLGIVDTGIGGIDGSRGNGSMHSKD